MRMYTASQINTMIPLVLAVLHFTCSSAKSLNPKQTLHLPLAKQGKHSLLKQLATENKNTTNVTSQLLSEDKESQDVTSTVTSVVTSEAVHVGVNVTSEGKLTSSVVNSTNVEGRNATSHLTVAEGDVKEKNLQVVEPTNKTVVDGCVNHRCAAGSRCDSSEGIIHDTGMPYTCRCQRNMFGIFCTISKAEACSGCSQRGFYCLPTTMHWSGRFCYDTTKNWERQGTGACGRRDFSCDGDTLCVPPGALCDGVRDCKDGADETTYCP